MSLLARLAGADDSGGNPLGLSSRYTMPKEVRQARDREVGRSIARTQVIAMDVQGLEYVGAVAVQSVANINAAAERAAQACPYARGRTDFIADVVATAAARKLQELGGP